MQPTSFPESNKPLGRPSSMTDEECIYCWRLRLLERLRVLSGHTQPPVKLSASFPFARFGKKVEDDKVAADAG